MAPKKGKSSKKAAAKRPYRDPSVEGPAVMEDEGYPQEEMDFEGEPTGTHEDLDYLRDEFAQEVEGVLEELANLEERIQDDKELVSDAYNRINDILNRI